MTWYSSHTPLPPSMSRACRAMSSAFPHELRFSIDTASGGALGGEGGGQDAEFHTLPPPAGPPQAPIWGREPLGPHLPSSLRRPRRRQACSPSAISVTMSASFFCTSWFRARGAPNCLLRDTTGGDTHAWGGSRGI